MTSVEQHTDTTQVTKPGKPLVQESKTISFAVDTVENEAQPLPGIKSFKVEAQKRLNGETVEASGYFKGNTPVKITKMNGFLTTVWHAYAKHYPLAMAPQHIWTLILQGLATHVELNAERVRSSLVNHEGKMVIRVREDSFVKGNPNNPWQNTLNKFSAAIKPKMNQEIHALFTRRFSTSTPVDIACAEITLMDAMKDYFDFRCKTMCGIPRIYLEGTDQDWTDLLSRVEQLAMYDAEQNFGLGYWWQILQPIVTEFGRSAQGQVNTEFWQNFFKTSGGSGGPFVTGWINAFFPYLDSKKKNPACLAWDSKERARCYGGGPSEDEIPGGLSAAPFIWEYYSEEYKMKFVSGFFGMEQVPDTLAVRPLVGWAVCDTNVVPRAVLEREWHSTQEKEGMRRQDLVWSLRDEIRGVLGNTDGWNIWQPNFHRWQERFNGGSYNPMSRFCQPEQEVDLTNKGILEFTEAFDQWYNGLKESWEKEKAARTKSTHPIQ